MTYIDTSPGAPALPLNVAFIGPDGAIESAYGDEIARDVRLVFYEDGLTLDDLHAHPETTYLLVLTSFPSATT